MFEDDDENDIKCWIWVIIHREPTRFVKFGLSLFKPEHNNDELRQYALVEDNYLGIKVFVVIWHNSEIKQLLTKFLIKQ